eukprot:3744808-Prymnesium_polylepis.3
MQRSASTALQRPGGLRRAPRFARCRGSQQVLSTPEALELKGKLLDGSRDQRTRTGTMRTCTGCASRNGSIRRSRFAVSCAGDSISPCLAGVVVACWMIACQHDPVSAALPQTTSE